MRASTIRKKVCEWRKVRNFSLGACGRPWPSHVGIVLDYLRERVDEPCRARSCCFGFCFHGKKLAAFLCLNTFQCRRFFGICEPGNA